MFQIELIKDDLRIGNKLSKRRLDLNLTITSVANKSGITRSYLSLIESNKKTPDYKVLKSICQNLSLDIDELILNSYLSEGINPNCVKKNIAELEAEFKRLKLKFQTIQRNKELVKS